MSLKFSFSKSLIISSLLLTGVANHTFAETSRDADAAPTSIKETISALKEVISDTVPDLEILDIYPSPMPGIYEVETKDSGLLYSTHDGSYFLSGDLFSTVAGRLVNVTEQQRSSDRADLIAEVPKAEKIVFSPDGEVKSSITVFTDVDCGYCRKFHQEVPALNDMGIEVNYVAFPRAGVGSETYNKMVSAWCADDPNLALSNLKTGVSVKVATCDNTIAEQHMLGRQVGVTGTPAIVLDSGQLIPGYLTAEKLGKALQVM